LERRPEGKEKAVCGTVSNEREAANKWAKKKKKEKYGWRGRELETEAKDTP